jgi:hypothetical protein
MLYFRFCALCVRTLHAARLHCAQLGAAGHCRLPRPLRVIPLLLLRQCSLRITASLNIAAKCPTFRRSQ